MAKVFGINTKIRGKVGEYIYCQTKVGTVVSEAPVKPITPLRTQSQMNIRTQWANLGAIYKQFDSMLRRGFEELPPHMSVYNAFIQEAEVPKAANTRKNRENVNEQLFVATERNAKIRYEGYKKLSEM